MWDIGLRGAGSGAPPPPPFLFVLVLSSRGEERPPLPPAPRRPRDGGGEGGAWTLRDRGRQVRGGNPRAWLGVRPSPRVTGGYLGSGKVASLRKQNLLDLPRRTLTALPPRGPRGPRTALNIKGREPPRPCLRNWAPPIPTPEARKERRGPVRSSPYLQLQGLKNSPPTPLFPIIRLCLAHTSTDCGARGRVLGEDGARPARTPGRKNTFTPPPRPRPPPLGPRQGRASDAERESEGRGARDGASERRRGRARGSQLGPRAGAPLQEPSLLFRASSLPPSRPETHNTPGPFPRSDPDLGGPFPTPGE